MEQKYKFVFKSYGGHMILIEENSGFGSATSLGSAYNDLTNGSSSGRRIPIWIKSVDGTNSIEQVKKKTGLEQVYFLIDKKGVEKMYQGYYLHLDLLSLFATYLSPEYKFDGAQLMNMIQTKDKNGLDSKIDKLVKINNEAEREFKKKSQVADKFVHLLIYRKGENSKYSFSKTKHEASSAQARGRKTNKEVFFRKRVDFGDFHRKFKAKLQNGFKAAVINTVEFHHVDLTDDDVKKMASECFEDLLDGCEDKPQKDTEPTTVVSSGVFKSPLPVKKTMFDGKKDDESHMGDTEDTQLNETNIDDIDLFDLDASYLDKDGLFG